MRLAKDAKNTNKTQDDRKGMDETMLVIFKIPQKLEEPLQLQNAK